MSRTEEILRATIDGDEYTKTPQSREEELLLELKQAIEGGGGASVVPNPEGEATETLEKLDVNDVIYGIPSGGGETVIIKLKDNNGKLPDDMKNSDVYAMIEAGKNVIIIDNNGFVYRYTNADGGRYKFISFYVLYETNVLNYYVRAANIENSSSLYVGRSNADKFYPAG